MNRSSPFGSKFFQPASQILRNSVILAKEQLKVLDDAALELGVTNSSVMDSRPSRSTSKAPDELTPRSIPLVSISRSPSPLARIRSAAQSEDEDEWEYGDAAQSRPLVNKGANAYHNQPAGFFKRGGVGHFLFGTNVGSQVYIALLVIWVGGCQFGLLLMNRFILWTGTYKFPYPMTMTLLQLAIAHLLILAFASLTRGLESLFNLLGLGALVAPSHAYTRGNRGARYKGGQRHRSAMQNISEWLSHSSGGIAGGGLFEFQGRTVRHVLPVALVFSLKVVLSNLSYAYAVLPMYMLARIAIIPVSLLLTTVLLRETHSVATLSSSLTAVLNLLMATIEPGRVTWESIIAGVFSSLFVALFPVVQVRAYKQLVADLVPQGDILAPSDDDAAPAYLGTKEETRAYWRLLHYTSLLSMMLIAPIVLVSGEIQQIRRNCYFMDVPWFWFLMVCGGAGSWAVSSFFFLLVKATGPLTATFVSIPRSAFQLMVLDKFRMPVHSWVGVALCWASCLWYVGVRRREEWNRMRGNLQGGM
ncbi:GDP-fucose transmembrane transporter-like protein [Elsinoe australis]|uniref:GDP-mannose transporter n=1 Tax=Elsinoe australis TaxID=40998 RepID=A0A4U7B0Y8_9PEZI|nr:GDP-fucose transmembrane transporter-like protein [Elsinoe australis]